MDRTTLIATISWATGANLDGDSDVSSIGLGTLETTAKTLVSYRESLGTYNGLLVLLRGLSDSSIAPIRALFAHYLDVLGEYLADVPLIMWEDLVEATLAANESLGGPELLQEVWCSLLAHSLNSPCASQVSRHALYALQDYLDTPLAADWLMQVASHPGIANEDLVEVGLA